VTAPAAFRRGWSTTFSAWMLTLPGLVAQVCFGLMPIAFAFVVGFQKYYFVKPPEWVGAKNLQDVAGDPLILTAFANTLWYAALSLGLTFLIPIFVSILLMEMRSHTIRVMMVLWFLPVASTASIAIWKYLYNPRLGLLNGWITALGLPPLKWLDDPTLAMFCLVLPGLILFGPGLIYIAALQSIPDELYEAAELEGAGFFTKIRVVTLPRLRPIIAMMLLFSLIGSLQVFEMPFILTGGGPGYATTTVVMHIYNLAFNSYNLGKATALAIVLFFVIMGLVAIQRRLYRENVD
jgi:multiple sugar transport system permease protein